MLTGERAFRGETTADTLTAILTTDPEEMSRWVRPVPPNLDRLVRRCLEKDPEERFQSARDVAFALDVESNSGGGGEAEAPTIPRRRWRGWATTATVALLAAAAVAWVSHRLRSSPPSPPRLVQLTWGRGVTESARFTADGNTVVFTAYWDGKPPDILSQRLDQTEAVSLGLPPARLLSVSSQGELAVLLGPPEESGVVRRGTLARVPLSGGAVRPLLEDVADADWAPDGRELAVVRCRESQCQLGYPVGHVLGSAPAAAPRLRVSPRGDRVAISLVKGLALVDRAGNTTRIELGEFLYGFVWPLRGDALLATVADPDLRRARTLRRVALDGTVTDLYVAPGHLPVHDVARDGRVLLHHGFERSVVRGRPLGVTEDREIPGFRQGWSLGFSDDGTRVLVEDGASRRIYLASLAGEAAVPLGPGMGWGLSGDGRWAVVLGFASMILMPTGPGEALRFETPQLWEIDQPSYWLERVWHVDGERVGFNGAEPGRPPRGFLFERSTGRVRAVTPETTVALRGLAPDEHVLAYAKDGSLAFHPLGGGDAREVRARLPPDWGGLWGEGVIRLSGDGRFLFLREGAAALRVERLELATGRRAPWGVLKPEEMTGVYGVFNCLLTPDGEGYVYTYGRAFTDLYLLEGLRF